MNQKKIKDRLFSMTLLIWIFPLFAFISTGVLYYRYWQQRGPIIQIQFSEAAGIEAEKTPIRFRGVTVGKVEDVTIAENGKGVIVHARLLRDARVLAAEGSQFSIVEPQVDFQGIRGLETIFKGSYIRATQGFGTATTKFVGQNESEASELIANSITYNLKSPAVDSISSGDPVMYRGFKIGAVRSVNLSSSAQYVETQIQIEKKYVKVIRKNTKFWQKSAIEAKLGLFNSDVKVGPLESLMKGGISLATPDKPDKIADAGSQFELLTSPPKDFEKWNPDL